MGGEAAVAIGLPAPSQGPASLTLAVLGLRGRKLKVEVRGLGERRVLSLTADQLLHRRKQAAGRLLESGLLAVRVPTLRAWERALRAACERAPNVRVASTIALERLEGAGERLRARLRLDGEPVDLDLSPRELHAYERVRSRLLTEERVLAPRLGRDEWQDQLARATGQRSRSERVAEAIAALLAEPQALAHEGCFGGPERRALGAGRVLRKGDRLYVASDRVRAALGAQGAWEGKAVLRAALAALGCGEHRLGPAEDRVRVWSFAASTVEGRATRAELPNADAATALEIGGEFLDTAASGLAAKVEAREPAPRPAISRIAIGETVAVEVGEAVVSGLTFGQLLAQRRRVVGALLEQGVHGLLPLPDLMEWEELVGAGAERSGLARAATLELDGLAPTSRGVRAWFQAGPRRVALDLRGRDLLTHRRVRARLAHEHGILVPRLRDGDWQAGLARGLGQPSCDEPQPSDRERGAAPPRAARALPGAEADTDLVVTRVSLRDRTWHLALAAGEARAALSLSARQLFGRPEPIARELAKRGLLVRAPSAPEWERARDEGLRRSAFAFAASLSVDGLERAGDGAVRAWLRVDGRRVPLDLRGRELLSHARVRARLAEAVRLVVPRLRDAEWHERLAAGHGAGCAARAAAAAFEASVPASRAPARPPTLATPGGS